MGKFGLGKIVSVSVYLVSKRMNQNVKKKTETRANKKGQKKSIGISIGYIGLGKKYPFRFRKKNFLETILGFVL